MNDYSDIIPPPRTTEAHVELDEQEREALNRRMNDLVAHFAEHPVVTITYFVPDDRKAGGKYVTVTGVVRKYRTDERQLVMDGGEVIRVEDIGAVE